MVDEFENSHHDLMKNMGQVGSSQREADFLDSLGEIAGVDKPTEVDQSMPVGQKVKSIREQKGLSLEDLSQRTGLEVERLRRIEDEPASPPLGVLIKLGKGLDMSFGTLISSGEERAYTVVRKKDRKAMSRYASQRGTSYGYSYEALAPEMTNRSMEPFIVTLQQTEEDVPLSSHDGQEFIFVLKGTMEAIVGESREVLEPGDCIYYQSSEPHLVRPADQGPTVILAVIYGGDH